MTLVTGYSQTLTAHGSSFNGSVTIPIVQPFTAGDVVVYRVGQGIAALAGDATAVFLDEYTPGGTLVQSVPLPTTSVNGGNQALVASGSASSEGQINLSANGEFVVLTGYDAALGTASVSSTTSVSTPRTIGLVSASGNVYTTTALNDFATGNNIRGATSIDGSNLWVTGAAGGLAFTTPGSTTSTALDPAGEQNLRDVVITDGNLYVSSQKSDVAASVGSGTPTVPPQTLTALPGLPSPANTVNANGFYLAHLNGAGTAVDTLYVTDQVANSGAGQIDKYSLVGGTWVASVVGRRRRRRHRRDRSGQRRQRHALCHGQRRDRHQRGVVQLHGHDRI